MPVLAMAFDLRTELNNVVAPEISPYRGPILFDRGGPLANDENIFTNGGYGLVDTGEKKILVTCSHVWNGFLAEREEDARVRMLVCLEYNPQTLIPFNDLKPIDQDERLDLVTFDMSPLRGACLTRKFYALHQNPPRKLNIGDKLVLIGNPGIYRMEVTAGLLTGATVYGVNVSSVDGFRFQADISDVNVQEKLPPARKPQSSPHGGISGSPCFLYRDGRPCELVGFVTGDWMKLLFFSHASCINRDGTIKRL
jgi:hypothetical protein